MWGSSIRFFDCFQRKTVFIEQTLKYSFFDVGAHLRLTV